MKPPKKTLPERRTTLLKRAEIETLFQRLSENLPEPKTELEYLNPFTLLVAVVLSAQATDVGVNKATRALFKLADTPKKMAALGEGGIQDHIRTIGLFRTKAKNLYALCCLLIDHHGGQIPHDREALEALPGVGRKTANVVLNVAFGEPTIAVDTHIFRVSNRTGLALGKTPRAVEDGLMEVVPKTYRQGAHHWLILHGRYTCKAPKPLCMSCPIIDVCRYEAKMTLVPSKVKKAPADPVVVKKKAVSAAKTSTGGGGPLSRRKG